MSDKFILADDGVTPIPCDDLLVWGKWLERKPSGRIVAQDHIGDAKVSTVFLGLDHRFTGGGAPILWETMIFGGEHDQFCERYTSHADAVAGHAKALQLVSAVKA